MTTVASQLEAVINGFAKNAPEEMKKPILASRKDLVETFDPSKAIQVGDKMPSFKLPSAVNDEVSSDTLLTQGPLIITFYRGEWCPFCNIAIRGMQKRLDEIKAKGATLVAITPEKPDGTLSMTEKHELNFPVLTDLHNEFARRLGIVWKQPDTLRPVFEKFNHNLPVRNGDDSFELPIPATFLIDKNGVVRNAYLEPDYVKRIEPQMVIDWLDAL